MTDLQDAAGRLANRIPLEQGDRELLVEAARLVANPNIEAAAEAGYEYVHGGTRWEDAEPLDRERFIGEAERIVAAALTPGDEQ